MTQEIQETLITALQAKREDANRELGHFETRLHLSRMEVESLEADYGRIRRRYEEIQKALQFVLNAKPSS
jgi:hypothetical protein